ncbi:hypothetical protein ACIQVL_22030 [Streptomyces sp. NPDC090499]|uniref:hypothetical protein n=1 Tax=unclassified Streptomyces TaxID=2593676 RepID=UPI003810D791
MTFATYKVTFKRTDAAFGAWTYGRLTLTDGGRHTVRSAVALRATRFTAPAEAAVTGADGSTVLNTRVS